MDASFQDLLADSVQTPNTPVIPIFKKREFSSIGIFISWLPLPPLSPRFCVAHLYLYRAFHCHIWPFHLSMVRNRVSGQTWVGYNSNCNSVVINYNLGSNCYNCNCNSLFAKVIVM